MRVSVLESFVRHGVCLAVLLISCSAWPASPVLRVLFQRFPSVVPGELP